MIILLVYTIFVFIFCPVKNPKSRPSGISLYWRVFLFYYIYVKMLKAASIWEKNVCIFREVNYLILTQLGSLEKMFKKLSLVTIRLHLFNLGERESYSLIYVFIALPWSFVLTHRILFALLGQSLMYGTFTLRATRGRPLRYVCTEYVGRYVIK